MFEKFIHRTIEFRFNRPADHINRHGNGISGKIVFRGGCAMFLSNKGQVGFVNDKMVAFGNRVSPQMPTKYRDIPCNKICTGGSMTEVFDERWGSNTRWSKNMADLQRQWMQTDIRSCFYDNSD